MEFKLNAFGSYIDLASRRMGGSVITANDEFFVQKENLVNPLPPVSCKGQSGNRGGVYDGWETRRRRTPGNDWVIVRLGAPGIVRGIVVDTAFFRGNYPERISVDACSMEGAVGEEDLLSDQVEWVNIVPESTCEGDSENDYQVFDEHRFTHVRLNIFPDGGVARLRVYGNALPDPRDLAGLSLDLASAENGALVTESSDGFFNPAENVILPGESRTSKEGWETKRRRTPGTDWLTVALPAPGHIIQAEIDTTNFIGNFPEHCSLEGFDQDAGKIDDPESWWTLLPQIETRADTRHRFRIDDSRQVTHVRLNIHPDGGLARLRLRGYLSEQGREILVDSWLRSLPGSHRESLVADRGEGKSPEAAFESVRAHLIRELPSSPRV